MASQDSMDELSRAILNISKAINYLGVNLYRQLAREKGNIFFSPLSLSNALSMLFCGSRRETSAEMRRVLGYESASIQDEEVQRYFQLLFSALEKAPDSYTLTSANVVFSQHDFHIKEAFKTLLAESFGAMTLEVDFQNNSAQAVQQANNWVKEKTNGMIPELLESLDPETVMVILNAVYFKGFWMHQFKQNDTCFQTFYNNGLEDNAKQIEMMHMKKSVPFVENELFKALQLPYKGDEISMLFILPNSQNRLSELEDKINLDFVEQLNTQFFKQEVTIALPKFRLEYSKTMKDPFKSLGMNRIFCSGAHFGGISDSEDLLVSEIVHKSVLVVNEEGSEAAAATAVQVTLMCLPVYREFIVDHPFLFIIYNSKTNLILFMGRVEEL